MKKSKQNFKKIEDLLSLSFRELSTEYSNERNLLIEKLSSETKLIASSKIKKLSKLYTDQLSRYSSQFITSVFDSFNPNIHLDENDKAEIINKFNRYFNNLLSFLKNNLNDDLSAENISDSAKDTFIRGLLINSNSIKQNTIQKISINIDKHNDKIEFKLDNRFDSFIHWFKNNPVISILIILFIIVVSLARFTDALNKLENNLGHLLNSNKVEQQTHKELNVQVKIINTTNQKAEIFPYLKYYLNENLGLQLKQYTGGRLKLERIKKAKNKNDYIIFPSDTAYYILTLGKYLTNTDLFQRGNGDIDLQLQVVGSKKFYLKTLPFMEDALKRYYVLFKIESDTSVSGS